MGTIQTPEFGLRVSKLFQMSGETQAFRAMEEVVTPVVIIADISREANRGDIFAGAVNQPLNAANASKIAFVNVAGSGVNFLPSLLRFSAHTSNTEIMVQLEPAAAYIPLVAGVSLRDNATVSPLVFVGSNPAGVGVLPATFIAQATATGGTVDVPCEGMIVPPGRAVVAYTSVINSSFDMMVIWKMENLVA
jgi:hypothetical protein